MKIARTSPRDLSKLLTSTTKPAPRTQAARSPAAAPSSRDTFQPAASRAAVKKAQLQQRADKADDSTKTAQDHKKTTKDAVRKMLDQIADVNRATNL